MIADSSSGRGLPPLVRSLSPLRFARLRRATAVKIRYNEVVRSVLLCRPISQSRRGFFAEQGIEPIVATGQGGDKTMAALLSNGADIALIGPETAIYVLTGDSPTKARIFCGLTSTDGFMLIGREKVDKFDWSTLKGRTSWASVRAAPRFCSSKRRCGKRH